ncbi:MAG: hypothetical protein EXX96DRAFT_474428 [Benjaminiella poitrasii]|nr:MAG: hypothetical protein EXX96DRAFT_474428 [Benjaminiella poitrasii]
MLLNQGCSIHKNMRYTSSRHLVGSIFLYVLTEKLLLVNCVEVFSRSRTWDAH